MASNRYPEERYLLDRKALAEHATLAVLKNAAAGPPELEPWLAGAVRKEPLTIHDINGTPLFHDFAVARGKELFGHVRVAASQVLGSAVVATELGPRLWNYDEAVKKLTPKVKREFARSKLSAPKLVCYSYPKLGVMFEVDDGNATTQAIYDVSSLTRVPLKPERAGSEGFHAWSFYGALSDAERKKRLARFKKVEAERGAIPDKIRREMLTARSLLSVHDKLDAVLVYRRKVTKLLQYCTHYGHTHARSHHCFVLHGQQVNDYCAVATCQMILCYYRHYHSQDDIAPSLGYAPGGCQADQSPGYKSLTCNHLDASFDSSPTWEKGRDQIDLLRPFKSGISGHARAVAGYSYVRWIWALGLEEKKLYVYDPWPWNADYALGGAVTWEDWDAVTHTNYVYAHVDCP
ncbi:MAG TPA: hypothetical protein VFL64_00815 [Rhizobacter sp.]|nr:hypothetical protein [Rhizobacter sp.]